jgi:2-phosphoglycolate phosphatase
MTRPAPLVFDLDGTLIDSRRDIAAACNHALLAIGRAALPLDQITCHVGSGARALIRGVLGEQAEVDLEELLGHFQAYYLSHPVDHNQLMPGARECLALRAERKVALCTNKPHHLTEAVLAALGWSDAFDVVVAPRKGDAIKPDGEPLRRVAAALDVPPQELIMVGDGPQDIGAGKAVGAYTVGVEGGFLPLARLVEAGPDVLLTSLSELPLHLTTL